MGSAAPAVWVAWLERYLALSLAADAKLPERDVAPVVERIRRDVIADERAGVPGRRPDSTLHQPQ